MSTILRFRFRFFRWLLLGVLLSGFWLVWPISRPTPAQSQVPAAFVAGRTAYEQADYATAIAQWESLLNQTQNLAQQVTLLNNLSLAHQALQNWEAAQEIIEHSLTLQDYDLTTRQLIQPPADPLRLAQSLDVYGQWHDLRGNSETAIALWQQAESYYTPAVSEHFQPWFENQLNQARALQYLGYHLDTQALLLSLHSTLAETTAISANTHVDLAIALGRILRLVGQLDTDNIPQLSAVSILETALETWVPQADGDRRSALHLELGNTQRARTQQARRLRESSMSGLPRNAVTEDEIAALTVSTLSHYQQAAALAVTPLQTVAAQLNELSFRAQLDPNNPEIASLTKALLATVESLPPDLPGLKSKLAFAQQAIALAQVQPILALGRPELADFLHTTINQATDLHDFQLQGESWALLGHLYETLGQTPTNLDDALTATNRALEFALKAQQPELEYRLQWQLGRILKRQDKVKAAIAAFTASVQTIQSLRRDLVILNPDVQFSFRDAIEPVYRELADLLLKEEAPSQENLKAARETIDTLQTLEVENYLRQSCNTNALEKIDKIVEEFDTAAFIYSIVLEDRLEVILKLPDQKQLLNHKVFNQEAWFASIINSLRGEVESTNAPSFSELGKNRSQQVYDWLIKPFQEKIDESDSNHLIFVMDKFFRDIPVSVLFDGEKYLIEQPYAASLAPGLQLIQPQPIQEEKISSVLMGLSEIRVDFPDHANFLPLKNVAQELDVIKSLVPASVSLNERFTSLELRRIVLSSESPILHLATHGEFSANVNETFLLAWDKRINLRELAGILRPRDQNNPNPIELLVLSACETISGGGQAALGLAGLAVQSGARGSIASFWTVDDAQTSQLMASFYRILSTESISKSEALRRAQLELLSQGASPYYWSAFTVLGNWL